MSKRYISKAKKKYIYIYIYRFIGLNPQIQYDYIK